MATIAEIRKQYPQYSDLSDKQLADSLRAKFYSDIPQDDFYRRIGLGGTDFIDDMQRGAGQAIAAVGSALRDVPIKAVSDLGKKAEDYGNEVVRANPADMPSIEDIKSVSDAIGYAGERIAEIIPQAAAPLAAAGVTLLAGAAAPVVGAAGLTAGALSSYGQSYGGIREQQREQGIDEKGRAALFAAPSAALDVLGVGRFVPGAGRIVGDIVETGLRGIAKTGARVGAEEGITEVAQSALERAGAKKSLTDAEAQSEYLNSLAAGLVGGGGIGAGKATTQTFTTPIATEGQPTGEPQPTPPSVEGEPAPAAGPVPVGVSVPPVSGASPAAAPVGAGSGDTVTVEDDTVIIESPDGTIRVVPRPEWEAAQPKPATEPVVTEAPPVVEPVVTAPPVATEPPVAEPVVAAPPVAEPVVAPPTAGPAVTETPPIAEPVVTPPAAEPVAAPTPIQPAPPVAEPKPIPEDQLRATRNDDPEILKGIEGKTLPQVAEFMAKNGKIDTTRDIAGRAASVLRSFEKAGFRLEAGVSGQKPANTITKRLATRPPSTLGITGRAPAQFGLPSPFIGVAVRRNGGTNEETVTHELVHAATALALDNSSKLPKNSRVRMAAKDLRSLSNTVRSAIEADPANPLFSKFASNLNYHTDPHEVLAWGLTNPDYQAMLKAIPTKSGNAFTDFIRYIGKLLGLNEKDQNALRRLIEISEDILPRDKAGIKEVTRSSKIPLGGSVQPMILEQQTPTPAPITPTKETRAEGFARKLVDRFERLRVVQSLGQLRAGVEGFYEAARKFDSRAGELMQKFDRDYFRPIEKIMKEAGLNLDTVDFYLYARAAPARNARLQAKAENEIRRKMEANEASESDIQAAIAQAYADGKIPTAGSGITTQEAEDAMVGFEGMDYYPALQRIGSLFDRANRERMENNIQRGLVGRAAGERLLEEEPHYVPMKGRAADENLTEPAEDFESTMGYGGTGFGVSVREWYNTSGRSGKPFSPLGTFTSDVGTSIIRGERNRVGQKMMDFFIDNPSDAWRVYSYRNPPRDRSGNIQRPSPYDPNFMVVKRGGDTFYLRIEDPLLAKAAKNLNPPQMGAFLQFSNKITRLLSRSFTTANPDFFVPNIFRDLQSAALNLAADAPGLARAFGRNVKDRAAFRTVAGFEYGKPWGDPSLRSLYEQFKLDGGSVSWVQRETPEEVATRIQQDLKTLNDSLRDIKDAKTAKQKIDAIWSPTSKGFRAMVGALENTNAIFENGIRFAAYRAALDTGLSREKAAMVAREATVDFNRRGEAGALLNALYAFFNAGIQGSVRTARALSNNPFKTGKVSATQAALLGMMTTAATLAAANASMSDEDDDGKLFWDKIPDYEKERNLIIMHPNGRSYEKIPMPYGFGFFPYVATRVMDAARRGDGMGAVGLDIATAALGNFSPVQFGAGSLSGSVARAATPTVFKPFVELLANENFMGKPIYNEPFDKGQSYASVARYNTWDGYKELSQFLNDISGGEGKVKGIINFPPESFEYLTEFMLGGVSNLAKSLYRTGGEGDALAAPVVRRLVGQPGKGRNVGEYYEREEKSRVVNQQMKDLTGSERQVLREKFPVETSPRVQAALTEARSRIRKLNEQRKNIQNLNINEGDRAERLEVLRERVDGEYVRFNRIYNQVEQATR